MDGFFKGFNLARALIVLCILGAGYMGWMVYKNQQRIDSLTSKLGLNDEWAFEAANGDWLKTKVEEAQKLAVECTDLNTQLAGEGLQGEDDPVTYIRDVARRDRIALGQLVVDPSVRSEKAYVDNIYRIRPDTSEASSRGKGEVLFDRTKLANFMWTLEDRSSRVRVRQFSMRSPQSITDRDYKRPGDLWNFSCEMVVRVKRDE